MRVGELHKLSTKISRRQRRAARGQRWNTKGGQDVKESMNNWTEVCDT